MPANPGLYPELATAGSLAAALASIAGQLGLDLGELLTEDDSLQVAGVAATGVGREPCWIRIGSESRVFFVEAWSQGIEMVRGATEDLGQVARAADAWRRGATLAEIREVAPFVRSGEILEAHEHGPLEAVAVQWRPLQHPPARAALALAEAALAEPVLRQLFPFLSHWSLYFSTRPGLSRRRRGSGRSLVSRDHH